MKVLRIVLRIACASVSGIAGLTLWSTVVAQELSASAVPIPDPTDLSSFFDAHVGDHLVSQEIAGAVVTVVQDGRTLFTKGYGLADVAAGIPMDPATTQVRVGSISKIVTAIALLQQVEQGRLDLDEDVQAHLDFRIGSRPDASITLRYLLSHRAGFEERFKDLVGVEPPPGTLGDVLKANVPPLIHEPGSVVAYSNYGMALAGHLAERVASRSFADLVEEEVFHPLGMQASTFRQPVPPVPGIFQSAGYRTAGQLPMSESVLYGPAGALTTTASDMARLMIALLDGGGAEGGRILSPESVAAMWMRQGVIDERLPGMGLGFYQEDRNGLAIVGHAGSTQFFHSDLHLIPSKRLGIFISFNSLGKDRAALRLRRQVFRAFLDRYFPHLPQTSAASDAKGTYIAGNFVSTRRVERGFMAIPGLFSQTTASVDDQGILRVSTFLDITGSPKRWLPAGPAEYREADGPGKLVVLKGTDGRIAGIATNDQLPIAFLQPVSGLRDGRVVLPLAASVLLVSGLRALWGLALLFRQGKAQPPPPGWLLFAGDRLCAAAILASLVGWTQFALSGLADPSALSRDNDAVLTVLYGLTAVASLSAPFSIAVLVNACKTPGAWGRRLGASAGTAAALVFLMLAWTFGLLNFTLVY